MMKLKAKEKILNASWHLKNNKMVADSTSDRIEWLIKNYLIWIGEDENGWNILY